MQLETYDKADGRRVRLTADELDRLLAEYDTNTTRQIALALMGRCGCRSKEALDAKKRDVVQGETGRWFLRIPSGKGGKERQTPMPADLAGMIRVQTEQKDPDETILGIKNTRTLRKWVKNGGRRASSCRRRRPMEVRRSPRSPTDLGTSDA